MTIPVGGDTPHRRFNPLTGEWVLVSPQRTDRPWQGQAEETDSQRRDKHDPDCYLCPGGTRAGGMKNPNYTGTFVFDNDFPALLPVTSLPADSANGTDPLFRLESAPGECRVICFSPRHDLSLAQLPVAQVRAVVDLWVSQSTELGQKYRWVQIFENKGTVMGCSNLHPHGQIWASEFLPTEAAKVDLNQRHYLQQHGTRLLDDYLAREQADTQRLVLANAEWTAVVPFWAIWPYETLILPNRPAAQFSDLDAAARDGLAELLKGLLTKYDQLFDVPFPYSMGWHGAPFGETARDHWTLHGHIYSPLLRSATVKKFMVGYEMMAEVQRDLTPEQAATRLKSLAASF